MNGALVYVDYLNLYKKNNILNIQDIDSQIQPSTVNVYPVVPSIVFLDLSDHSFLLAWTIFFALLFLVLLLSFSLFYSAQLPLDLK